MRRLCPCMVLVAVLAGSCLMVAISLDGPGVSGIALAAPDENATATYGIVGGEAQPVGQVGVTYSLSPEGKAVIQLRRDSARKAETVHLFLTSFLSDDKQIASVGIADSRGADQDPVQDLMVQFGEGVRFLPVVVQTRSWKPGRKYDGKLILVSEEGKAFAMAVSLLGTERFSFPGADLDSENAIQCVLSGDGRTALQIRQESGLGVTKVRLILSGFHSPDKKSTALVGFLSGEGSGQVSVPELEKAFSPGQMQVPVEIEARFWEPGVSYSGTLTLVPEVGEPQSRKITLLAANVMSTPVVEPKTIALNDTLWLPFLPHQENGRCMFTVRDKTGKRPVEGLFVGQEGQSSTPPGNFNLQDNFVIRLCRVDVAGLAAESSAELSGPERRLGSIPAGDRRGLEMAVKDLPAGKHEFQFRVGAANSDPDAGQVVSLTVNVKDAWPWAAATLVIAGLLSYFVTKGVENQRERVKLEGRIRGLQKDWLAALPPLEPIAWLGAVQRQSLDLLQQATLGLVPAPREIAQRLDKAERLLGLLRSYRDLRTGLRRSRLDRLERSRFYAELDGTIRTIEPELLEESTVTTIKERLEKLRSVLMDPTEHDQQYIRAKVARIRSEVVPEKLAAGEDLDQLRALLEPILVEQQECPSKFQLKEMDQLCATLEVLWLWRLHRERRDELLQLVISGRSEGLGLDDILDRSDAYIWADLKEAVEAGKVRVKPSRQLPTLEGACALEPVSFLLWLEDRDLAISYPVNARIESEWRFTLETAQGPVQWTQHAVGRRSVQYVPAPGMLTIQVTLRFLDESLALAPAELEVAESKQLRLRNAFGLSEVLATGAALVIAVVSGLQGGKYLDNPTFGSLNDYLQLFLWGAAVDQAKNLLKVVRGPGAAGGNSQ